MAYRIEKKVIDGFLENQFYYRDFCGMAAGIGSSAKGIEYKKTLGTASVKTGKPLEEDAVFHMASVAKLFTATGIMLLQEKGMLDIDEKLTSYMPWFEMADKRYKKITIRQMLTHTSAMPDVSDYHWEQALTEEKALKDYAISGEVANAHLLWEPEEGKFAYSNMAYDLLGLLIKEVSGESYEDFVTKNIFGPMGMDDSTLLTMERKDRERMCDPHDKNADKKFEVLPHYPYNRSHAPSSTLTSNMDDMAKWASAWLSGSFPKAETKEAMWKEYARVRNNGEKMGLGWFSRIQSGRTLYGHEGMDDGFRASFWLCPQEDLFIMIFANMSKGPVKKVNKELFELLIS